VATPIVLLLIGLAVTLPYYRRQSAIDAIEAVGGVVHWDVGGPEWLRSRVVGEWVRAVDSPKFVNLDGSQEARRAMPSLATLSEVNAIHLKSDRRDR
jgi:hypothetical protein